MTVGDLNAVIEQAIGGEPLTVTLDGRNLFSVNVRYPRDIREDVERLRRVFVPVQRGSGMGMASPGSTPPPRSRASPRRSSAARRGRRTRRSGRLATRPEDFEKGGHDGQEEALYVCGRSVAAAVAYVRIARAGREATPAPQTGRHSGDARRADAPSSATPAVANSSELRHAPKAALPENEPAIGRAAGFSPTAPR